MTHSVLRSFLLALSVCAILPGMAIGGDAMASASRAASPNELRIWVDARAGTGEPVHWIAEGSVYEYPSGKKLFGMIGFDTSTVIWPAESGDDVIHLTRKTFTFTDAETGEILTEYEGQPVEAIAYPYQLIRYRIKDGLIYGDVEQGVAPNIQQIKAKEGMPARWIGPNTLAVNAPVFINIPLPGGQQLEAWENYDFFLHTGPNIDEPHQMSWQRYGDLPGFAGTGKAIYHLLSWRVESHAEFPAELLAWAKANKAMWLRPPASIEEVRELQKGDAGERWAQPGP